VQRPSIDQTMLQIATTWAERSTCTRLHVGAVIAQDGRHVGSGYNGAPSGMPHCVHIRDIQCTTAIHAEVNAIAYAARHGVRVQGATLYATHSPCLSCAQLIVAAGFRRLVYAEAFRDASGLRFADSAGLAVYRYPL
jgi:dCMP deaminase